MVSYHLNATLPSFSSGGTQSFRILRQNSPMERCASPTPVTLVSAIRITLPNVTDLVVIELDTDDLPYVCIFI